MATDMFLQLEGIEGESEDSKCPKWIEILSWSHSFSQPTAAVRGSSGPTVEKANHSDLSITKYLDKATDDLLSKLWSGDTISKASLKCFRADSADTKTPVNYLTIDMEQVIVSNYSISAGGGDLPLENISLAYGKVTYTYAEQKKADGTGGGASPTSHDLKTDEVGG
ncbi:MAG: type VI secretion system tube protein Hcp [Pseudomonadota bacterium]